MIDITKLLQSDSALTGVRAVNRSSAWRAVSVCGAGPERAEGTRDEGTSGSADITWLRVT